MLQLFSFLRGLCKFFLAVAAFLSHIRTHRQAGRKHLSVCTVMLLLHIADVCWVSVFWLCSLGGFEGVWVARLILSPSEYQLPGEQESGFGFNIGRGVYQSCYTNAPLGKLPATTHQGLDRVFTLYMYLSTTFCIWHKSIQTIFWFWYGCQQQQHKCIYFTLYQIKKNIFLSDTV